MTPYFSSIARVDALEIAAEAWMGTPFRPNACLRGAAGGASCQTLVWAVYDAAGFRATPAPTRAQINHFRHRRESLILPALAAIPARMLPLPAGTEPQPGDLLYFADEDCEHLAIALRDGLMVQALMRYGVVRVRRDDATWAGRLRALWRPME